MIDELDELTVKIEQEYESCLEIPDANEDSNDNGGVTSKILDIASVTTEANRATIELYDSGCSKHMSSYRHLFINFQSIKTKHICAAN